MFMNVDSQLPWDMRATKYLPFAAEEGSLARMQILQTSALVKSILNSPTHSLHHGLELEAAPFSAGPHVRAHSVINSPMAPQGLTPRGLLISSEHPHPLTQRSTLASSAKETGSLRRPERGPFSTTGDLC